MSFLSKKYIEPYFIFILFVVGFFLRFYQLDISPLGYDTDQSAILSFGWNFYNREVPFRIFAHEFTQFETLSSYYYGLFDYFKLNPRLGPTILGFLEVGLLYLLVTKLLTRRLAVYAALFLLLNPLHIFYSRIVGTCVGVSIFVLSYLLLNKKHWFQSLVNTVGLLYYTAFRTVIVQNIFSAIKSKNKKWVITSLIPPVLLVTIQFFLNEPLLSIFKRGEYIKNLPDYNIFIAYLRSLFLFILPPVENWFTQFKMHTSMEVSHVFSELSGSWTPPLLWFGSLFFVYGLLKRDKNLSDIYLTILFSLIFVGFSPSYSHFLYILPLIVLITIHGFSQLEIKFNTFSKIILYLGFGFSAFNSYSYIQKLSAHENFYQNLGNRTHLVTNKLSEYIPKETPQTRIFYFSAYSYYQLRYLAETQRKFIPGLVDDVEKTSEWLHLNSNFGHNQYIIFDIPQDNELPSHSHYDFLRKESEKLIQLEEHLKVYSQIQEIKEVKHKGNLLAKIYIVRWPP